MSRRRFLFFAPGAGIFLALAVAVAGWMQTNRLTFTQWPAGEYGTSGRDVDVYTPNLARESLILFWKDADGKPYGSAAALAAQNTNVKIALNSGIYEESPEGFRPLGLHIERGAKLVPLNTRSNASGNFYLQPNGVFWWGDDGAGILQTPDYAMAGLTPLFATQSGPMLVIDGELNPVFHRDSTNRHTRAAVGVTRDGRLCIAFSNAQVTFHALATLFRDGLDCPNALYLDGAIISRYIADNPDAKGDGPKAGILALIEK